MALEVQEIAIQMQVSDGGGAARKAAAPSESCDGKSDLSPSERDTLVQECVRRVLQALKEAKER